MSCFDGSVLVFVSYREEWASQPKATVNSLFAHAIG